MILRSQLRMNKNIIFLFISCIMIMFTLLVLIHKSADELNSTKKELSHVKQQHDSLYTQLQNAIELKLRLEKNLENEKTDEKMKLEELQKLLNQEKQKCQKEKDDAGSRYETLNQRCNLIKAENKEKGDNVDTLNKKLLDVEEEVAKMNVELKSVLAESERKDKLIDELNGKLKTAEKSFVPSKKSTQGTNNAPAPVLAKQAHLAPAPSHAKGPSTPQINPQAIKEDDFPKQVAPPPNGEESAIQKDMRDVADNPVPKAPLENVVKAPQLQTDDDKNKDNGAEVGQDDQKNQPQMFLPYPQDANKLVSSASNNAAENRDALPAPVPIVANENDRSKEIPKHMKEYAAPAGDYNGEDDGENL